MDTTKYFYNKSDNCEGYFCKDTIQWIWIFSNEFKTSEGIGVGSSFKEIQKSFPELYANYRISVDGMNDIYVTSKKYPNVEFHFTDEAMTIDIEKEENESDGLVPEDGSHFYADSAVYMIRIYSQME